MKTSLKHLGLVLSLSLLASCNGVLKLDCNDYEIALNNAIRNNDPDTVRGVLRRRKINIDIFCAEHNTPLLEAVVEGNLEIVRLLLDHGASMGRVPYGAGETPLVAAVLEENLKMVELLLDYGADVNLAVKKGRARRSFCNSQHAEAHATPGIFWGQYHRAPVRYVYHSNTTIEGGSPLIHAAKIGNTEIIKLLLQRKAKINLKDANGRTVFDYKGFYKPAIFLWAVSEGWDYGVQKFLERKEWPVDVLDENKDTALCLAALAGNRKLVKKLIELGAEPDHSNKRGRTPLMCAARSGDLPTVKAIIKEGVHMNAKDDKGWSALRYARYWNKDKNIANYLLEKGIAEYDPVKIAKTVTKDVVLKAAEKAIDKI